MDRYSHLSHAFDVHALAFPIWLDCPFSSTSDIVARKSRKMGRMRMNVERALRSAGLSGPGDVMLLTQLALCLFVRSVITIQFSSCNATTCDI